MLGSILTVQFGLIVSLLKIITEVESHASILYVDYGSRMATMTVEHDSFKRDLTRAGGSYQACMREVTV